MVSVGVREERVHRRFLGLTISLSLLATTVVGIPQQPAGAVPLPTGFGEQIVFSGLTLPTNIEFAPDGRVYVAEKRGTIKEFSNIADTTPTIVADLTDKVLGVWDRGLLGMALHPDFPANPSIYVLYTYDAPPWTNQAPYWNDNCDSVGGHASGRCVVTGRLSRFRLGSSNEEVLIRDWCQQYASHSIGDLKFGSDGMLYVSSGDGANYSTVDYGQFAGNPCGDPANEGGAFRSQDVRTLGDPTGLNGTLLRLDPETGLGAPSNTNIAAVDPNVGRIVAYGLRNPYRFAIRPGTHEVWLGDVGWGTWEDIERVTDPLATPVNFGWPCYEGAAKQPNYTTANRPLCQTLYPPTGAGQTPPYYAYHHSAAVVPDEDCTPGGDAVSGMAFYPTAGGSYPSSFGGVLFFADHARGCIWAMKPAVPGGAPDPSKIEVFHDEAVSPTDVEIGPDGELYYVDYLGGTVRRVRYYTGNQPPTATFNVSLVSGRTMKLDGSASTDNDASDVGNLTYAWDFGDGTHGTGPVVTHEYPAATAYTAKLKVTDPLGAYTEVTQTVLPGNALPSAIIDSPPTELKWAVGNTVTFAGRGADPETGAVPASAMTWQLRMRHCEQLNACHTHIMQSWAGVAGGSFVAPDHEYPSYLELALTVKDPNGQAHTAVRRLDPKTVQVRVETNVPGLLVTAGPRSQATPYTIEAIEGASLTISAATPQTRGGMRYAFWFWSDYRPQAHVITAGSQGRYKAIYVRCWGPPQFIVPDQCLRRPTIVPRPTPPQSRDPIPIRGRLP